MDVSVVNIAMPHMMGSFGQDLLTITWVSTAYSIAEIIMITMTAFWSTLLGRKRLYLASMTIFTLGSILAGTSQTFGQMLFYRVIQGAGDGTLIPASQAITREKFPPAEQGMAMALYSMGVMLAPTIGPVVGGWLVDSWGWRWIFYINVPFAIVGILMAVRSFRIRRTSNAAFRTSIGVVSPCLRSVLPHCKSFSNVGRRSTGSRRIGS